MKRSESLIDRDMVKCQVQVKRCQARLWRQQRQKVAHRQQMEMRRVQECVQIEENEHETSSALAPMHREHRAGEAGRSRCSYDGAFVVELWNELIQRGRWLCLVACEIRRSQHNRRQKVKRPNREI